MTVETKTITMYYGMYKTQINKIYDTSSIIKSRRREVQYTTPRFLYYM